MQPRIWSFRVRHILEAIEKIQNYTSGMSFDEFAANSMVIDAVIRNFEVMGVAAGQIPDDVTSRYSHIPWSQMRGMRNILAHQYEDIRLDVVWDTIHQELPTLIPLLISLQEQET